MKLIDVFIKLANDEIKDQTILKIYDHIGDIYTYTFDEKFKAFYDECNDELGGDFEISNKFLNYNVELITPKEKKYYLRLDGDDKLSYINLNKYASYEIAGKNEYVGYKTKFTQEEIDENMLLKFIEQHGIKEEVED
ncbi:hypothetical protein [Enterococcus cecorum]|uniref:Uncharacterized protein n=1 Tax=Enterococcus cecorum DSM 20682 = ATCC 43198 TaxID=1121864 RepID=S1R174_9ENTE|nr:hypothetical protein [Enterococcus cecorum]EOX18993.1 hypothetical protein I567_00747 [Enterococcus cecorum DSM 20682 = ATCC 43198]ESK61277.1 hypothetical protein OMO_01337 [Enterococcus cecorum DSM 20682 = ATCC 43198]CAI3431007.1 hypothetical protein CIRMBP1318_01219 [Enterococcus cecorum DSM 20682 = ATCC 43198]SQE56698.1 Uncharacterised protein [Enterococcus cecorum]